MLLKIVLQPGMLPRATRYSVKLCLFETSRWTYLRCLLGAEWGIKRIFNFNLTLKKDSAEEHKATKKRVRRSLSTESVDEPRSQAEV